MSSRIQAFVVTLDQDVHEDDVYRIRDAIEMIRGVADASPVPVDPSDLIARMRVREEVRARLIDAVQTAFKAREGT